MPLQNEALCGFESYKEESLSITIYVLCIYIQIVLYMKTFLLCKAYGFCYVPTIKVYQHKLNKKEFKLAFKLWCACVRSSFSLSIIPDDDIHIFLLCKSYSSRWGTWDQVSTTPELEKSFRLCLFLEYIYSLCKSYANLRVQFSSLPSYWIFQGFIIIMKFE